MRNEYFQVNRPVGAGHSRAADVIRIRKALRETGHGSSPPEPSGTYDASAIAAIERFQRDFGLKPDGVVLPDGPTERVLDAALAARRSGGAEGQQTLRNLFRTLSEEGLQFRRTGTGADEPSAFVDEDGQAASMEQLTEIFARSPQREGIRTAMILQEMERRRKSESDQGGTQHDDGRAADGDAPVNWGDILLKLVPLLVFPEKLSTDDTRKRPPGSPGEQAPESLGNRKAEPAKTTVPVEIDPQVPPLVPDLRKFDRDDVPPPPHLNFPPVLPGREVEEARPGVLIFPDQTGLFDDLNIIERRGNERTRAELERLRDYVWKHILSSNPDWKHIAGGRNKDTGEEIPELWIPGPQKAMEELLGQKVDGRPGGKFVDLTFKNTKTGQIVHVQTVDLDKNGKPTKRELDNAEVIRRATNNGWVLLFGKGKIPK